MGRKYMRELIAVGVVVVLIVPMVFIVQANAHLSFCLLCTSSLPVRLLESRLFRNSSRSLYHCLETTLENVKKHVNVKALNLRSVSFIISSNVFIKLRIHLKGIEAEIYANAKMCIDKCFPKSKESNVDSATCLLECYEEHIKKHWDIVHTKKKELWGLVKDS